MKYFGKVGFVETINTGNGLWEPVVEERNMYGDIVRDNRRLDVGPSVNPDYTISTQFSLVADAYCYDHLAYLAYVTYRGVKWAVTSVDPAGYPRILVNVGKVYNGPEAVDDEPY